MKFIPILFSTSMVQAILEDKKTMTRRTKGLECVNDEPDFYTWLREYDQLDIPREAVRNDDKFYYAFTGKYNNSTTVVTHCPYGKSGDVLWVRETWCKKYIDETLTETEYTYYASDDKHIVLSDGDGCAVLNKDGSERLAWRPSIHMPKTACRIFLEITSIKVERLRDINPEDAVKEGISWNKGPVQSGFGINNSTSHVSAIACFEELWRKINGAESWEANPFVWCVSFKRIDKPDSF